MDQKLKNLLIILGGIAVVLVLVIILFSKRSFFMRFMSLFLEETGDDDYDAPAPRKASEPMRRAVSSHHEPPQRNQQPQRRRNDDVQKKTSEPIVEMATLIRKSDDRLRVIESTGQEKLIDEYYELVFVTRKGRTLKIECSRKAYDCIPFNQQGSLTFKRNTLVKFKYYGDTIYN